MRSRRMAMRHAPERVACGTVVARVAVRGVVERCAIVRSRRVAMRRAPSLRGLWHRRGVGSCAGRGGEVCDRAVAACGLRHAPMRMACGAVVSWAAVQGAVEVCDRAVAACGLRHASMRMACGTVVARWGVCDRAVEACGGGRTAIGDMLLFCVPARYACLLCRSVPQL